MLRRWWHALDPRARCPSVVAARPLPPDGRPLPDQAPGGPSLHGDRVLHGIYAIYVIRLRAAEKNGSNNWWGCSLKLDAPSAHGRSEPEDHLCPHQASTPRNWMGEERAAAQHQRRNTMAAR